MQRKTTWLLAAALSFVPLLVWSQANDARPLHMIINFPAGAGTDITGRAFAEAFKEAIGRPVVVNNRGGASGTIGVAALTNAKPDGDTLGTVTSIPITLQPHLIKSASYTPADLTPICRLTNAPTSLVASPKSGIDNVVQLVERARREPGKLNLGVPGLHSGPHIAVIQFMEAAKINMLVVPHQADNNAIQPLATGEIDLAVAAPAFGPANGFKTLAISAAERLPGLPDIPTLTELGFPAVQTVSLGIMGPKGLKPEFVRSMESACKSAFENPKFQAFLTQMRQSPSYAGAAEYGAELQRDFNMMKALAQRLGLKPQ
jgi:tripartite-type tricarboxylate transporter receptor subunit TctC